jgi:hypothetical protein
MAIAQKLRLTGIAIAFSSTSKYTNFYSLILNFNHHLDPYPICLIALISIAFWQGHIRPVYCHPSEFPKQQSSQ